MEAYSEGNTAWPAGQHTTGHTRCYSGMCIKFTVRVGKNPLGITLCVGAQFIPIAKMDIRMQHSEVLTLMLSG